MTDLAEAGLCGLCGWRHVGRGCPSPEEVRAMLLDVQRAAGDAAAALDVLRVAALGAHLDEEPDEQR